jgi:hypothetical protein
MDASQKHAERWKLYKPIYTLYDSIYVNVKNKWNYPTVEQVKVVARSVESDWREIYEQSHRRVTGGNVLMCDKRFCKTHVLICHNSNNATNKSWVFHSLWILSQSDKYYYHTVCTFEMH